MGYRWHKGRFLSDEEYDEEISTDWVIAVFALLGVIIGAEFNHWIIGGIIGLVVAVITKVIMPELILLLGVLFKLFLFVGIVFFVIKCSQGF